MSLNNQPTPHLNETDLKDRTLQLTGKTLTSLESISDEELSNMSDESFNKLFEDIKFVEKGLEFVKSRDVEPKQVSRDELFAKTTETLELVESLTDEQLGQLTDDQLDQINHAFDIRKSLLAPERRLERYIETSVNPITNESTEQEIIQTVDALGQAIIPPDLPIAKESLIPKDIFSFEDEFAKSVQAGLLRVPETVWEDVQMLAYDAAAGLNLIPDSVANRTKQEILIERERELGNVPSKQVAEIANELGAFAVPAGVVSRAGKAVLKGGKFSEIAPKTAGFLTEALAGGVAGALTAPTDRTTGTLIGAGVQGPFGIFARGTIKPVQKDIAQASELTGIPIAKSQIVGGTTREATEDFLVNAPIIGTGKFFNKQYQSFVNAVDNMLSDTSNIIGRNSDDLLLKRELSDTAKGYSSIFQHLDDNLTRSQQQVSAMYERVSSNLKNLNREGFIETRTAAANLLDSKPVFVDALPKSFKNYFEELSNLPLGSFDDILSHRKILDDFIRTAHTSNDPALKALIPEMQALRKAATKDLESIAQKGGQLQAFKGAQNVYKQKVLPLSDIVSQGRNAHDKAVSIISKAIKSETPEGSVKAQEIIKGLNAKGKSEMGYALLDYIARKSVSKDMVFDVKKFTRLTREKSTELGLTLNAEQVQTLKGIEKIAENTSAWRLKIGAKIASTEPNLIKNSMALGVASIGWLISKPAGRRLLAKIGSNKTSTLDVVGEIIKLTSAAMATQRIDETSPSAIAPLNTGDQ